MYKITATSKKTNNSASVEVDSNEYRQSTVTELQSKALSSLYVHMLSKSNPALEYKTFLEVHGPFVIWTEVKKAGSWESVFKVEVNKRFNFNLNGGNFKKRESVD